jgi:hypothetical protein
MIITILTNMAINLGILSFSSGKETIAELKRKYRIHRFKRKMEARKQLEQDRRDVYALYRSSNRQNSFCKNPEDIELSVDNLLPRGNETHQRLVIDNPNM